MSRLTYNETKNVLILDFNKKDKVDEGILSVAEQTDYKHMVMFQYSPKKNAVRYKLGNLISFKARLVDSTIERREMILLLCNFYKSLNHLLLNGIAPNKIDWDYDLIFLDENGEVYFTVYPLKVKTVEGIGIFSCLVDIINSFKPFSSNDERIKDFLVSKLENVRNGEMSKEVFLVKLKEVLLNDFYHKIGADYRPNMLKTIITGVSVEEFLPKEEVEEHVTTTVGDMTYSLNNLIMDIQEHTTFMDDLEDDVEDEYTQIMDMSEEDNDEPKVLNGYLVRNDGSAYLINKREVLFGKQTKKGNSDVDYALEDNTAISRVHFKIITTGSTFLAEDLNATNGTFVDGIKLIKGEPMELVDGSIVRVANEDFTFKIEEV